MSKHSVNYSLAPTHTSLRTSAPSPPPPLPSCLCRELLAPGGKLLKKGDRITRHQYAQTLRSIGEKGADFFYNSSFTEELVRELREGYNSVMTVEDLHNYTAIEREVVTSQFADFEVVGVPPPSSGAVLGLILNILNGIHTSCSFSLSKFCSSEQAPLCAYKNQMVGRPGVQRSCCLFKSTHNAVYILVSLSVSQATTSLNLVLGASRTIELWKPSSLPMASGCVLETLHLMRQLTR